MNTTGRSKGRSLLKSKKRGLAGALALLFLLPLAAGAGGVVTDCTEAALRAAMAGGGTVTFACDGTITLASTITIAADTTLNASGHQITISGNGAARVFYVSANVKFSVISLTVANGFCNDTGAGILNGGGTVNAISVAFASNRLVWTNGYPQGGAVGNGGTLNLQNCSFTGNSAISAGPTVAAGGAIYNSGIMNASGCMFSGNSASSVPMGPTGLGPWDQIYQRGGSTAGGAVYNVGIAVIEGSTFSGNIASGGAGLFAYAALGAYDAPAGGTGSGGAICNEDELTVRASSFLGNKAQGGKGGSGGNVPGHSFPGGSGGVGGDARGAAVYGSIQADSTVLVNCTIAQNSAVGGDGGAGGQGGTGGTGGPGGSGGVGGNASTAAVYNGGSVGLVNCTIAENNAVGGGGGAGGPGSEPSFSQYSPSPSGGSGGGGGSACGTIWSKSGQVGVTNCTIALNSGQAGSGGPGGAGGPGEPAIGIIPPTPPGPDGPWGANGTATGGVVGVQLLNTLIAYNSPSNCSGMIGDAGHNLSSDASCAFTNRGSMNNTDPKLGPLADNGGPTLTMALLPSSPAIDAGDTSLAPTTDQRGFPRPSGAAADIGAFEQGQSVRVLPFPVILPVAPSFGIQTHRFGFRISWATNVPVVVEACTSLANLNWSPVATNTLSDGWSDFSDPDLTNHPARFYRVRSP